MARGPVPVAGGAARWLLLAAMAVAPALPGAAQQRPPQRPQPQAIPGAAPPAQAPDSAPSGTALSAAPTPPAPKPAPPGTAAQAEPEPDSAAPPANSPDAATPGKSADPDTAPPPAPPAETAPPAPPAWQALRESDFDHAACRLGLFALGAKWQAAAPVSDPQDRDCGIARPIRLMQVVPGVDIPGGALMRCDLALALGLWTRDFVQPAAQHLAGSPRLTGLVPGSTYQCRIRVGSGQDKISQHALGNAFDVMAFRFEGRDDLPVSPRQDSGDMAEAFQRAVRGAACLYFTTVLGPGSNAAHDDHLHLDLAARKGGWRLCQ